MTSTEDLIATLVMDSRPVRPLRPPMVRAALWLATASAIVTGIVLTHGLRPDLSIQLGNPVMVTEWVGAVLTGVLGAIATFHVSIPGRSVRWALLPVPALGLWLASLGVGCFTDWVRLGPDGLALGTSFGCFETIVFTSVPLGATLLIMVRHAGPVRPGPTVLLGGLSVAALSSAGLSLFHHLDTALMVLVWHGTAIATVMLLARTNARPLFRWIGLKQL